MNCIKVGKENCGAIDLYYEDHGQGKPVVLIHGWPLSSASWEKQVPFLLEAGYRAISYDRRGFGNSDKPTCGYNYDTFAADLNTLMIKFDLHNATLIGFSMGGGEVARYIATYGTERVNQVIFISSITPFLLKGQDNSDGVDGAVFEEIKKALIKDRPAFLSSFFTNFFNADLLKDNKISEEAMQMYWNIAAGASPVGTLDCVSSWLLDFRNDLRQCRIPVLVIHGDADRILPLSATGKRMSEFIIGSKLVVVKDAPHGLCWTHSEEINRELLNFIN